jgi:hypothetical protein
MPTKYRAPELFYMWDSDESKKNTYQFVVATSEVPERKSTTQV